MRWILHGDLTPAVSQALRQRGDTVSTPAELGLAGTQPIDILNAANARQLDVMTNVAELADVPFSQRARFGRSIVFLQLTGGDVEQGDAITRLFERYRRLTPGRLYTVTATRVKIRQLPKG